MAGTVTSYVNLGEGYDFKDMVKTGASNRGQSK
ncbi:hypothetical protein JOC93_000745 [Priestia taiwanensis]|nr:hypothetical protein [Priestia taiwanensis]